MPPGRMALCAMGCLALMVPAPASAGPLLTQIEMPKPGWKLRPGERTAVRIRVAGGTVDQLHWSLGLRRDTTGEATELSAGSGEVTDSGVSELVADQLVAGEGYTLTLKANDGVTTSESTASVHVTDPLYALIPLDEGNWWQERYRMYSGDASGSRLLYAGLPINPLGHELHLLDRSKGQRDVLRVEVTSSESVRLSGDGLRLFFNGVFRPPVGDGGIALGFLDIGTRALSVVHGNAGDFYSTDTTGRRVVYWAVAPGNTLQYFLYDEASGAGTQLTDDPDAVRYRVGADDCPQLFATRPFISADGSKVVVITKATLGLEPPDDSVGCRVFVYSVDERTWRQAVALPKSIVIDVPALSADGRWLSFRAQSRPGVPSSAVLLNLQTGEVQDPVIDVRPYLTSDSVVTGDAQGIIISTQADLDPRVGNIDHNLELFHYDLQTRTFRQITESVGGVDSTPGGCPSFRPVVSRAGDVLVFLFHVLSVEQCHLDGPMRHARDGFVFRFVRAVRRRPGNRSPVFDPISDQRVRAGETLAFSLRAQDPDGDPISFYAQVKEGTDVPPGSIVTDNHDGTASFSWPTRPENAGTTILRVAAFDEGGGEVVQDVTLTVEGDAPRTTTPSPTTVPTPQPTELPGACPGDCDGDGLVIVNELLTAISIALGRAPLSVCPPATCGADGSVTVACLTRAVNAALMGCP